MKCSKAFLTLGTLGAGILLPIIGASAQAPDLPEGPGRAFVAQNCTGCHGSDLLTTQRRSVGEWEEVVTRMIANGDDLTEDQYKEVITYLGTYLGPEPAPGAQSSANAAGDASSHSAHHSK